MLEPQRSESLLLYVFLKISFQEFEVSLGFYCFEYISVKVEIAILYIRD